MTYLAQFKQDHPDWDEDHILAYIDYNCPRTGLSCIHDTNGSPACRDCWNREIPEPKNNEREENTMNESTPTPILTTRKTKADLLKEIADLKKQVEHLDRYKQFEDAADTTAAMCKAYETAGFSREEAFELTKLMIELAAKTGRR